MSGMTKARLTAILAGHPPAPQIFAETGTFYGERAALATELFNAVYTVELSPTLYQAARSRYAALPIHFVLGDSREVVPQWARTIPAPVCWYLDAHWFDLNRGRTRAGAARAAAAQVAGADGLPLWDELAAIATRPYRDIIIVDDARDFGTNAPTVEWESISLERIAAYFPDHQEAVIVVDQAVVYR